MRLRSDSKAPSVKLGGLFSLVEELCRPVRQGDW